MGLLLRILMRLNKIFRLAFILCSLIFFVPVLADANRSGGAAKEPEKLVKFGVIDWNEKPIFTIDLPKRLLKQVDCEDYRVKGDLHLCGHFAGELFVFLTEPENSTSGRILGLTVTAYGPQKNSSLVKKILNSNTPPTRPIDVGVFGGAKFYIIDRDEPSIGSDQIRRYARIFIFDSAKYAIQFNFSEGAFTKTADSIKLRAVDFNDWKLQKQVIDLMSTVKLSSDVGKAIEVDDGLFKKFSRKE